MQASEQRHASGVGAVVGDRQPARHPLLATADQRGPQSPARHQLERQLARLGQEPHRLPDHDAAARAGACAARGAREPGRRAADRAPCRRRTRAHRPPMPRDETAGPAARARRPRAAAAERPGGRAPTTAASTPACARPHRQGGTSFRAARARRAADLRHMRTGAAAGAAALAGGLAALARGRAATTPRPRRTAASRATRGRAGRSRAASSRSARTNPGSFEIDRARQGIRIRAPVDALRRSRASPLGPRVRRLLSFVAPGSRARLHDSLERSQTAFAALRGAMAFQTEAGCRMAWC